jgi:hypothetical protein
VQSQAPPSTHRLAWGAAALSAALVVPAGLLPGFTVAIGAYVGAGDDQRILAPLERTFTLLGYGHPRYLAAVGAALVALAAAAWGWRRARAWLPLALMLAAAVAGLSLTSAAVRASNGPSGGVFLADAVKEVQALAEQRPESRDPAFDTSSYSARPAIGWRITQGAFYALLLISSVVLGRRMTREGWIAAGVVLAAAMVLVFELPGENCGGSELGHDPDSNPLGLLAVFAGGACAGLGIGAISRRRAIGALAVVAGPAAAFVAAVVLAAKDCAFY